LANQDIMALFRIASILTLLHILTGIPASADVGTRPLLLHERSVLLQQAERMRGDTSVTAQRSADSLRAAVIALDGRIFASYDETLARLSAQQRRRSANDRALTFFALFCCLVALASILALWLAGQRIQRTQGSGLLSLLQRLFLDLVLRVNPDRADDAAVTRVSPVVILGVLGMVVSIAVYFISVLL
jgi:hypothetical protein